MSKETNEEKEFSEKVDRLLAGEEIETGKDISEDYRSAINFAQKLTESRADPSPHFKDQLKQRLLLKLTQQEVETAREKERGICPVGCRRRRAQGIDRIPAHGD